MKIGVILFSNIRYAPFLQTYIDMFQEMDEMEYKVMYFNRFKDLEEEINENYIPISWIGRGTNAAPRYERILNFLLFKFRINGMIRRERYDFLLVLTTFPAVLISKTLVNKYRTRYIVDIRDYTKENNRFYRKIEERVLAHSRLNIISSPDFREFLPNCNARVMHNFRDGIVSRDACALKKSTTIIKIAYVGSIGYVRFCIKLIDLVYKDDRFMFSFYGNEVGSNAVSEYIEQLNNDRIKYYGPFTPSQKDEIYAKSDLIFNCYGNERPLVKYAVSNKYYDGALYHKPLLVSPHTTMERLSCSFAFSLDLEKVKSLDELNDWYRSLDESEFNSYADRVLQNAKNENDETQKAIMCAIRGC